MAAFSSPLVSVIRWGPDAEKHGDDWDWSVTVLHLSPTEIELQAMDKPLTVAIWRDVMDLLWASGIRRILIKRKHGSKIIDCWKDLRPNKDNVAVEDERWVKNWLNGYR